MQYSFIKSLLESVWMIHPGAASVGFQLLKGALSGLEFNQEPEPEDSIPYLISATSSNVIPISDPDQLSFARDNDKYVFVLPLRGTVLKHDAMCGPRGTRTLASRLIRMDKEKNVIGHIILTESGGGMAAAVPEMADAIQSITKPVVAWIDGMSASAAYYINSYCTHIMASRATDQVGCIGTLIQLQGYPKYAKLDDGSVVARIYADAASEKNEEYEAALEGNFTLIKERMLNPHNEQFKSDVRANRAAVLDDQLKGRTYVASEVIGTLIDSIGNFDAAVQKVVELSKAQQNGQKSTQKNNRKQMNQLTNLNAIESIHDFVVEDGSASFNEEQLQDIENALAAGNQAVTRVSELESEMNTMRDTATLNQQTIEARDARIAELETALETASNKDAAIESAAAVKDTDGNPASEVTSTLSESISYCENHLQKFK